MGKAMRAAALALGLGLGACAQAGAADAELPLVSNAKAAADSVSARIDERARLAGASQVSSRVDLISSAAAARAAVALLCQPEQFEAVSRAAQRMMEAKIVLAGSGSAAALAYAKDSARMKYKAMVAAHRGEQCADLGQLRLIAASEGFGD